MSNYRRAKTKEKFGFDSDKKVERMERTKAAAEVALRKKTDRRQRIEQNSLYKVLIKRAIGFDIIDAVLGFFEEIGDIASGLFGLLYIFLSLFVVRSIRLAIAVLYVTLVDLLIGLIPVAGSVVDAVFCGSYINRTMIKGFVEGDAKIKRRVNLIAAFGFFVVIGLAWTVISLLGIMIHYISKTLPAN